MCRTVEFMHSSSLFSGIGFFLAGFTPQQHLQYELMIIREGGVITDEYGPDCTHVVVHNLVLDDPICVTARRDRKTVVTRLWVNDSLEYKELMGIDNGLQREDITTMVQLMGSQLSKPLVARRVTHLICFKFEGEKYALAKAMNVTKIVNHQWLVDCLATWKILPEEPYSTKSGYECYLMLPEANLQN
ncbi:BRCT domain-containing protein At4g02110 [Spinacia oleracea]|uniref:BRCT domain-containing protein At4g02110 n=1 Tax=Spinacia oleracea TaxID=3562 RepID=A0A9R0JJ09_SPIOL|nr:BRCT domain-containing protein At4g02110-like [Spinacia oleracea]